MKKELRQKVVADRCGFYKSSYNNIEAVKRNITILTLQKIAFSLEEAIEEFLRE